MLSALHSSKSACEGHKHHAMNEETNTMLFFCSVSALVLLTDDDNDLTFEQALKGQIKELRKQLDKKASITVFSSHTEPETEIQTVEYVVAQPVADFRTTDS